MNRRSFTQTALLGASGLLAAQTWAGTARKPVVCSHVWVYSADKPNFDCFPVLDGVFADAKYAGIEAVELMERNLRHADAVEKIGGFISQYGVPVIGTSYDQPMWDKSRQTQILEDAELVIERLAKLKGKLVGLTVGDPGRRKTTAEQDTQAETLRHIQAICRKYNVVPNLHNHTAEVANDLYDLQSILQRVPDLALGPDLDWLFQAKVDVLTFLDKFGSKVVYMHLRDHVWTGTWAEALGDGVTDFRAIARKLKQINFGGDIAIELAFPGGFTPTRPIRDSLKKSRQLVKAIFSA